MGKLSEQKGCLICREVWFGLMYVHDKSYLSRLPCL